VFCGTDIAQVFALALLIRKSVPAAPCIRCSESSRNSSIIVERVNAGLAKARKKGIKLGRRPVKPAVEARIRELRGTGMGILKIGRTVGVGTSVVQRVLSAA